MSAAIALAALGLLLGAVLAWTARRFHVEVDPRIEKATALLPGVNCGACGFPGCARYAEAVITGSAASNLCAPGGPEAAAGLAALLGLEAAPVERQVAVCLCRKKEVAVAYDYRGVRDCRAAAISGLAGGFLECAFGCLGLGTCVRACPFGALSIDADGLAFVDEVRCTGCRKCVAACPRGLMQVDPESRVIRIRCRNLDRGVTAARVCAHACIACRRCQKECASHAIEIVDNLAVINYEKCIFCGRCLEVCPKSCIVSLRAEREGLKSALSRR